MPMFDDFKAANNGSDQSAGRHAPPCTIVLKSGPWFVVSDVDAWEGQGRGVFATGRFGSSEEMDLLIPHDSIEYIRYDFEALREWEASNE